MDINYKKIASDIIEVAVKENIASVSYCATRLRLIVKDRSLIDDSKMQAINGVNGVFFNAGQYQIVLGPEIVKNVYDEVVALGVAGINK